MGDPWPLQKHCFELRLRTSTFGSMKLFNSDTNGINGVLSTPTFQARYRSRPLCHQFQERLETMVVLKENCHTNVDRDGVKSGVTQSAFKKNPSDSVEKHQHLKR